MSLTGTGPDGAGALLELCSVAETDRPDCLRLLGAAPTRGGTRALGILAGRLGHFNSDAAAPDPCISDAEWITAIARFAPILAEHHAVLGIDASVTVATLADVGRQLAIHRRAHECFGLETWSWLTHHLDGSLFRVGRLQFHLQQASGSHGPLAAGHWFLGIHIPADGPLHPLAVDEALAAAATFFALHFPERPIRAASCDSWLLDPHLATALPTSNISGFARRFEPFSVRPEPTDALYFTFETRDMSRVPALPRTTSLQRAVLDRIDAGGVWQVGTGWMPWPAAPPREVRTETHDKWPGRAGIED